MIVEIETITLYTVNRNDPADRGVENEQKRANNY